MNIIQLVEVSEVLQTKYTISKLFYIIRAGDTIQFHIKIVSEYQKECLLCAKEAKKIFWRSIEITIINPQIKMNKFLLFANIGQVIYISECANMKVTFIELSMWHLHSNVSKQAHVYSYGCANSFGMTLEYFSKNSCMYISSMIQNFCVKHTLTSKFTKFHYSSPEYGNIYLALIYREKFACYLCIYIASLRINVLQNKRITVR